MLLIYVFFSALLSSLATNKYSQYLRYREVFEPRKNGSSGCGNNEHYFQCNTNCLLDCQRYANDRPCRRIKCIPGCYCKPGFLRMGKGAFCARIGTCARYAYVAKFCQHGKCQTLPPTSMAKGSRKMRTSARKTKATKVYHLLKKSLVKLFRRMMKIKAN